MIDCSQYTGRWRQICEGKDGDGVPVLDDRKRLAWLLRRGFSEPEAMQYVKETDLGPAPTMPKRRPPLRMNGHRERQRSRTGTRLMEIFQREWKEIIPCSDCKAEIARLDTMTPDQVRSDFDDIADRIASRIEKVVPNLWWKIAAKADKVTFGYGRKRVAECLNEAIETGSLPKPARKQWRKPSRPVSHAVPDVPERLSDIVPRHLIYHMYPVSRNGWWQWNVDNLLRRIELFDGVRSVAILTPGKPHKSRRGASGRGTASGLDPVETVQAAFSGVRIDNWIIMRNDPAKREVLTRRALLDTLPADGVTFAAHAKGVTFPADNPDVWRWTEIMYRVCLDRWDAVEPILRAKFMAGPFQVRQRFGGSDWHYSGAFYWFRNDRRILSSPIPKQWFGTESWPGETVPYEHAGCLFGEGIGQTGWLYKSDHIAEVTKLFEREMADET